MSSTAVLPDPQTKPDVALEKSDVTEQKLVKFGKSDGFMQTLRERVDGYFEDTKQSKRDHPKLYLKCIIILAWLILSYTGLVFWADTWQAALALSISLGVAMSAVGFNIQHDGGHGAFSRFSWVNQLTAFSLDVLGGSSFIWKRTHNVIHHSYTNVTGIDGDIDLGVLGRLSPHQGRFWFHRFQHMYLWFLYGFITFKWQFYDDMMALLTGRIGNTKVPAPRGRDLTILLFGKVMFIVLAFGVPLYLHTWYHVAACFFVASFVQGVLLSIVFQLAHCVEHADFPMPDEESQRINSAWAVHQVETTVDFAQQNPVVTWYTGGLNFQIEHHLFPQICHIHYPTLAKIVKQTAEEFGVDYHCHTTMMSAVRSHFLWLKKMGQPGNPQVAAVS